MDNLILKQNLTQTYDLYMHISTSHVENVKEIESISAVSNFGIGLFTAIITGFTQLLGIENPFYADKIKKAEREATYLLERKAQKLTADGIMNFHIQVDGLTVFVYGTAYRKIDDNDDV